MAEVEKYTFDTLPADFHRPSRKTINNYFHGLGLGLVPPFHPMLHKEIPSLDPQDMRTREVKDAIARMALIVRGLEVAGRRVFGLHAVQAGIELPLTLISRPRSYTDVTYGKYMLVANPNVEIDDSVGSCTIPHGCFSGAPDAFARVPAPGKLTLGGFDHRGEPLVPLDFAGALATAVYHEYLHGTGKRMGDLAIKNGTQIDHRPPELAGEYAEFYPRLEDISKLPDWRIAYPHKQWRAATVTGQFDIAHLVQTR